MEPSPYRKVAEELTTKGFAFAQRLMSSARGFLEAHGLSDTVAASKIDPITFAGMAAVFQIREWERLGFFAHMPFHPVLHRAVCKNSADLSVRHNIDHMKSIALLLDVHNYYLANFTSISKATHSTLWKAVVMAELNLNGSVLSTPPQDTSLDLPDEADAGKPSPRSGKQKGDRGTWSEKEAARYAGCSPSTLKRMRADNQIPLNVFRQLKPGGKIHYHINTFVDWWEQRSKK